MIDPNEINLQVDDETLIPGINLDTPTEIPRGYVLNNGVLVEQTLVACPSCGNIHIQMEATATFRINLKHIWELVPPSQEELREYLNEMDNICYCPECEWEGKFSDLIVFEDKKV